MFCSGSQHLCSCLVLVVNLYHVNVLIYVLLARNIQLKQKVFIYVPLIWNIQLKQSLWPGIFSSNKVFICPFGLEYSVQKECVCPSLCHDLECSAQTEGVHMSLWLGMFSSNKVFICPFDLEYSAQTESVHMSLWPGIFSSKRVCLSVPLS